MALIHGLGLKGELAVGVLVLACCPGGITSNVMTRLARGDVALSTSFTALASVSLPLTLQLNAPALIEGELPDLYVGVLALRCACLRWPPFRPSSTLARIFCGAGPGQEARTTLHPFLERPVRPDSGDHDRKPVVHPDGQLSSLVPLLLFLNLAMLTVGTLVARVFTLPAAQVSTVAIESGLQNGTGGNAAGAVY